MQGACTMYWFPNCNKEIGMKFQRSLFAAVLAISALGVASVAQARSDVSWSIGVGVLPGVQVLVGNPQPVYVQPQQVYYQQPQVVYQQAPQQVYYQPAPVVYQRNPMYVQPQQVVYQPQVVFRPAQWGPPPHRHGHGHHRDRDGGYGNGWQR
jgi:hypothetical protein